MAFALNWHAYKSMIFTLIYYKKDIKKPTRTREKTELDRKQPRLYWKARKICYNILYIIVHALLAQARARYTVAICTIFEAKVRNTCPLLPQLLSADQSVKLFF